MCGIELFLTGKFKGNIYQQFLIFICVYLLILKLNFCYKTYFIRVCFTYMLQSKRIISNFLSFNYSNKLFLIVIFIQYCYLLLSSENKRFLYANKTKRVSSREIFLIAKSTTTIRTRAWVEICVSHSRRSIDLWDRKRVRYSCFEKCTSPMIDMFGTFNACDLRGLLDREYPYTIRSHPYVLPSKNMISITRIIF